MKKKKRLVLVKRSSDPSETLRKKGRHELPAALAGNRIRCSTYKGAVAGLEAFAVLPRVFEWTVVPGPADRQ